MYIIYLQSSSSNDDRWLICIEKRISEYRVFTVTGFKLCVTLHIAYENTWGDLRSISKIQSNMLLLKYACQILVTNSILLDLLKQVLLSLTWSTHLKEAYKVGKHQSVDLWKSIHHGNSCLGIGKVVDTVCVEVIWNEWWL